MKTYPAFGARADRLATWAAIALGASIPVSTALDGVLLVLILALWLLGADYREKFRLIRDNPVALAALWLLALVLAGTLYGHGPAREALNYAGKYADLLFIALLLPLFRDPERRRYGMIAFVAAMLVTLGLSYLLGTGAIGQNRVIHGFAGNAFVFKNHIAQNILMAFAAFLFALKTRYAVSVRARVAFGVLAALAVYNVLFMVQGRTGYVILAVLIVYLCVGWLRWKGAAVAAAVLIVLGTAAYQGSTALHERVDEAVQEYAQWHPGQGDETSVGLRLGFYVNTLAVIRAHPLLGVGTGGFVEAYRAQVKGTSMTPTTNPHNQYLLIAAELGLVGLASLLYLFFTQWRTAAALPTPFQRHLARGLVLTIMSGGLVNSLLIDHTERMFFAWMSALLFAGLHGVAARGKEG